MNTNVGDFMTPIAWYNGAIYTVDIEAPSVALTDDNLLTVVRKGVPNGDGTWSWTSNVVESRTMNDQYHSAASIGIDQNGYIHIAYNMHNSPWQYAVSANPGDISQFTFQGEPITQTQIDNIMLGQINFPDVGTAAVAGNQVTYPRFFNDRNGALYVAFRYAEYPAVTFFQRNFGCGIARYDTSTKSWKAIGGSLPLTSAQGVFSGSSFAYTTLAATGLWCDRLGLGFDMNNHLSALWEWYDYTQPQNGSPIVNFVSSPDGTTFTNAGGAALSLPITSPTAAEVFQLPLGTERYLGVLNDPSNHVVIQTVTPSTPAAYQLLQLNTTTGQWNEVGPVAYNASFVANDYANNLWAFASGPAILRSPSTSWGTAWKMSYQETTGSYGYPFAITVPSEKAIYVRYMQCASGTCKIRILKLATP